jgi:hypothetical protein
MFSHEVMSMRHGGESRKVRWLSMIITDPALIALRASLETIKDRRPRAARFRFWAKPSALPKFGTDAYCAGQRASFADADFLAATESGGSRIHATTRKSINAG